MENFPKNIVVLGAGFGGLRAALKIGKDLGRLGLTKKYGVILIDRNDHHTYTPLLYEVATTSKETANICKLHEIAAFKIEPILAGLPITFIRSEISSLDIMKGVVNLEDGQRISYDYAVFALGSEPNYYNIPGLKEHALPLKTFQNAIRIRDVIWNLALEEKTLIKVVVGGGGSTGVELAGELKAWCGELEKEFPACKLEVTIIEGAETILPGFLPRVIQKTERRLKRLGINVTLKEKIVSVQKEEISLESGEKIAYDVFIWTGGVKGSEVIGRMPVKIERQGRIEVLSEMECLPQTPDLKLHTRIYGIGDSVCFYDPKTQKPIPGVAPTAIAQANIAAHNIIEDIKKSEFQNYTPKAKSYKPYDYPYIIPVGGKYAIAKIGPLVISGFLAWLFKGLVELDYLYSITPPGKAFKIWFKGMKIFVQNDRLG